MSHKIRRGEVLRAIVVLIGIAGAISIVLIAPNVVQVLGKLLKSKKQTAYYVNRSLKKLEQKKIIETSNATNAGCTVRLTSHGRKMFSMYQIERIVPPKRSRWDGKWRAVVFDIPESEKWKRRLVRETLKRCGFIYFQQSIWVHAFPCAYIADLLKENLGLGQEVSFILIEKIDGEPWLQKKFKVI